MQAPPGKRLYALGGAWNQFLAYAGCPGCLSLGINHAIIINSAGAIFQWFLVCRKRRCISDVV